MFYNAETKSHASPLQLLQVTTETGLCLPQHQMCSLQAIQSQTEQLYLQVPELICATNVLPVSCSRMSWTMCKVNVNKCLNLITPGGNRKNHYQNFTTAAVRGILGHASLKVV